MAKRKISPTVTPNTLESMIEYTLISSILEIIYDMTKKLLEYPRDNTSMDPLRHLIKIKTWGTKWKRVIDKTVEWATWQWQMRRLTKKIFL
jgi:hypothetical protein